MISLILAALAVVVKAQDYSTYPQVPQTASINGFADPILSALPACATDCVKDSSTSNTPCPYWDTGCLCVMPQFGGTIGQCFASACEGSDVEAATAAATSLCNSVGANTWMIPSSVSAQLSTAAAAAAEVTSTSESAASSTSAPASSASASTAQSTSSSASAESTSDSAETSATASSAASSTQGSQTTSAPATGTTGSSTTSSSAAASSSVVFNSGSRVRASVYALLAVAGAWAVVAF